MITIHYLKDTVFRDIRWGITDALYAGKSADMTPVERAYAKGWYIPVARVESDDLEKAWKMMQNGVVTESWTLAPPDGVTPLVQPFRHAGDNSSYGWRSASIGDIFELSDGRRFVCAMVGFVEIPHENAPVHID